ncbi:unnamed protein product, partial [Ascophyllum nodosum]
EHFIAKWIAGEKAKAGLRHAVVCPNLTGKTKKRVRLSSGQANAFAAESSVAQGQWSSRACCDTAAISVSLFEGSIITPRKPTHLS